MLCRVLYETTICWVGGYHQSGKSVDMLLQDVFAPCPVATAAHSANEPLDFDVVMLRFHNFIVS